MSINVVKYLTHLIEQLYQLLIEQDENHWGKEDISNITNQLELIAKEQ